MSDLRIDGSQFVDISFVRDEATLEKLGERLKSRVLHTNEDLAAMTKSCDSLRPQVLTPESKEKLASLYGRVDALKLDNEIDQVVEESFSLLSKKGTLPQETLSIKIGEIQSQIARIWYDNGLSISNRRFIRIAAYNLAHAQVFASSKTADVLHNNAQFANLRKDQDMLPESELRASLIDAEEWEDAELAFDLCEMAHSFYQNKIHEGMNRLNSLTPSQKSRLEEICLAIGAEYPSHFVAEDVKEYQESMMRFVQALVAFAHEVGQGEPLLFTPSESEIHMMFEEANRFKD